jgi:hypothetical protein
MKVQLIPLALLVALFTAVMWWQGWRIDAANEQNGQFRLRIADLSQANETQAAQIKQAALEQAQTDVLLQTLGSQLEAVQDNTKRSTDAVNTAIATPASGRPNCAVEPLPADAVRLLKQPAAGGRG